MSTITKIFNENIITRLLFSLRHRGLVNILRYWYYDFLFEYRYHTDTTKKIEMKDLAFDSTNKEHGINYGAVRAAKFRDAIKKLPAEITNGGFIDFGSGKGRAMILAAELGFKKIYGVDFSPQLVEICKDNIEKFRQKNNTDSEFETFCMDATLFEIPVHDVDLFFLYNPFHQPVMGKVVEHIVASLRAHPRRAYVIYINPSNTAWKDCEYAHLISEWAEAWEIYELIVT